DGVMLGRKGAAYHLEFTRKAGHKVGRAPTADNLLVVYLPDAGEWERAVTGWRRPDTSRSRRSIRTWTGGGRRSRIRTDTGSCCRTQAGRPNHRRKLAGAAIPVFRAATSLPAPPAASPARSAVLRDRTMIRCKPKGLCSWNYFLDGEGHQASL